MMPRLLVAEEYDVVRTGLRSILEAQPDWVVVAEAADGKDAILKAINTKPDVAVINYAAARERHRGHTANSLAL